MEANGKSVLERLADALEHPAEDFDERDDDFVAYDDAYARRGVRGRADQSEPGTYM